MKYRLTLLVVLSLWANVVVAQQPELNWSEDGKRASYVYVDSERIKNYFVVDVQQKSRIPAFDNKSVAGPLGEVLGRELNPDRLPIDGLQLTADPAERLLVVAGKTYLWNTVEESLELVADAPSTSRLFLPPRGSGPSDLRTTVTFENRWDGEIELFWVDGSGRRTSYGTVKPGQVKKQSTYQGHVWLLQAIGGPMLGCYEATPDDVLLVDQKTIDGVERRQSDRPRRRRSSWAGRSASSPNGQWEVSVSNHDLWIQSKQESAEAQRLTESGSEDNTFANPRRQNSPSIIWSPDGKYFLAYQTAPVEDRKVYYIESSPRDQLQPKLQSYTYPKPGDPFPKQTLHLFGLNKDGGFEGRPLDDSLFPNPYDLRFLGWNEAGDAFRLLYNQRGHQVLRLLEVQAETAEVNVLAENQSDTFVQYSDGGKNYHRFLDDGRLIWASEKSGWNHLYLYDGSGNELNAITEGDWNVKRVVQVDSESQTVWFYAVGIRPEQDPYHEHFCRVNLDGTNLRVLTFGDGTHDVSFQQDGQYILDTWSRVDQAPVTELRDAETGDLIAELTRQDTKARVGERPLTARFSAPGRDGETEIWGILHFPKDFDPEQTYPVVEQIYAGPHDHHVPKSFRTRYGAHRFADAGMIVVQIDGMGTAWRSKKFHDVCYKNLRDAGFPDRIAWMKAAAKKYPQMDLSRVGIFGGSAGGQNAMAALLWHNDFYKVAVADCGCHDNRMDKRWWNEQWMGYPIDDSYIENSNMENAHLLEGNLMLLVGEEDRNVDPASTTQVVDRLVKANKDFEFVLVPGVGHGSASHPWAARKQLEFLKRHLQVPPQP